MYARGCDNINKLPAYARIHLSISSVNPSRMKTRTEICLTSELALPHCATHCCNGLSLWPSVLHSNANNATEICIAVHSPDLGRDSHLLPSDILRRGFTEKERLWELTAFTKVT